MKASASSFVVFLLLSTAVAQSRPVPPGIHQADAASAQGQREIPPPASPRSSFDPAKLKHDADELAALAQSVPTAIDQTTKGILQKDLADKLKRIEKLAKQLRSQVAR